MECGDMTHDFYEGTTTYDEGETLELALPMEWRKAVEDGVTNKLTGSLIHEAVYKGKTVAWYCMEYIPSINHTALIPVVYPVRNDKPNFQAGRFLGTPDYQACNVCWNSNGTCTVSSRASREGLNPVLYVYANSLSLTKPDFVVKSTQTQEKTLQATKSAESVTMTYGGAHTKWDGSMEWDNPWLEGTNFKSYDYPIVKIGNRIWTREDYNGEVPAGHDQVDRYGTHIEKGRVYYTSKTMQNAIDNTIPAGWHAAKDADWANLRSAISSDGKTTKVGERLQKQGNSGFNLEWNGWYSYELFRNRISSNPNYYYNISASCYGDHHMDYITGDCNHVAISTVNSKSSRAWRISSCSAALSWICNSTLTTKESFPHREAFFVPGNSKISFIHCQFD